MKKLIIASAIILASTASVQAKEGDWLLRLRTIHISPDESASTSIGGSVEADNYTVPELDFSYFFTDNIAVEAIAATSKHRTRTTAANIDLGNVWILPPTVTLQYHFVNKSPFKPYVGAGINYSHFYNEHAGSAINKIDYQDSIGPALQAGLDYKLDERYSINIDLKKIWINTDVKINNGAVTADVDLDPWVIGVGIGYKF